MSEVAGTIAVSKPASVLFPELYDRLKAIAGKHRRKAGAPASLSTTEVVHELFLRMAGECGPKFGHEYEFFTYAARAMRHVLVDLARKRLSMKQGGDQVRVNLTDPALGAVAFDPAQALELDEALRALEADSPRAARVVELHYFAGLPLQRVAELTSVATRTADRDWRYARSFLAVHMGGKPHAA